MIVIELAAENVKRIIAAKVTPTGPMVEIAGDNEQGKTSLLDAMLWALEGAGSFQRDPIRHGADKATVRVVLGPWKEGNLVVTRTIEKADDGRPYTTKLRVENDDGAQFPSGQAMLNALIKGLTLDPVAFERDKPEGQFATMRQFVPGVDFDAIDKANKADYDERTELNRNAKNTRSRADAIFVDPTASADPVDVDALIEQMATVSRHNDAVAAEARRRETLHSNVARARESAGRKFDEAEELRKRADALDAESADLHAHADRIAEEIASLPEMPKARDATALQGEIAAARKGNEAAADIARRRELIREAEGFEAQSRALTERMEMRDADKEKAIAAADMPVQGLGLAGGRVMLDGVPFEQASAAKRLRASVAIAMALRPELRVIRIEDGPLLDSRSMAIVEEMARERGFQVWIERLSPSSENALIIEDGSIRGQDVTEVSRELHTAKRKPRNAKKT